MIPYRALVPLLLAASLLLSGNGLHSTIVALRAISEGFSQTVIGLLLSAYFVGFIAGCRLAPRLIAEVGHIRAFTAFASLASAAALSHSVFVGPVVWLLLRVVTGFCFAALQMILESWLNEVATNRTRGKVLSIYRVTDFSTVTLAQAAVGLLDPALFVPFALVSIMLSVALVPIALTPVTPPAVPRRVKLDLRGLWRLSPMAAATAFCVGLAASAYWSMGPVFVTDLGFDSAVVGLFIAAIIFGGAIAQWPIGALSDKVDRRYVLIACSLGAGVSALLLATVMTSSEALLIIGAAAFGSFALPNFGLAIAHANDHAEPGTSIGVNGGLLLVYGIAAAFGAITAPLIMQAFGTNALFLWVAGVYGTLTLFGIYRVGRRDSPADKTPYVPIPRTSPAVFELSTKTAPGAVDPLPSRAAPR